MSGLRRPTQGSSTIGAGVPFSTIASHIQFNHVDRTGHAEQSGGTNASCLDINVQVAFKSLTTGSASESLLSQAPRSSTETIQICTRGIAIHKGDRRDFRVVLLSLTGDKAVTKRRL